jgi:hypothetical protein
MQALSLIMPAPFQPANTFIQSFSVANRGVWNYRIVP